MASTAAPDPASYNSSPAARPDSAKPDHDALADKQYGEPTTSYSSQASLETPVVVSETNENQSSPSSTGYITQIGMLFGILLAGPFLYKTITGKNPGRFFPWIN
jgi:hypothetical protein